MKIDPYNHKASFLEWRKKCQKGISGISKADSDLILKYVDDMEKGLNVSSFSQKGSRSYSRLVTLKNRAIFFSKLFKELYGLEDITKIKEEQLISFFSDMRNGKLKRNDGQDYKSACTYVKNFKAFWHWYIKVSKKQGLDIPDITMDGLGY